MHAQRGISLTGFMVFSFIAVAFLLLGFKIGPAYSEFYTIQKIMKTVAAEPSMASASRSDINVAFNNRAIIDNIKAIGVSDLEVEKTESGIVLSASYSVRVPLFYNLSACMEFNPTSAK